MLFHKKSILILVFIGLITYANSVFNGFVGDDHIVIVDNPFYSSWDNIPRLVQKSYISTSHSTDFNRKDWGSGSVSYRPVLSATYFLDRAFWKLNPFGYHLHNLVLHLANSLLVYALIMIMIQLRGVAFLTASLFCVHPIHSEAVCNIGYRADLLSLFFVLLSFLLFTRYPTCDGNKRKLFYGLSLAAFFLSLFAKESAITLPIIFLSYDYYFRRGLLKTQKWFYIGYLLVAIFYLYVYFLVFPNSALNSPLIPDQGIFVNLSVILMSWAGYVYAIFNPFVITSLPPFYMPFLNFLVMGPSILFYSLMILFISFISLIVKYFYKNKFTSFFMLWFIVFFIPISNVIPLTNPFAHRFVYLPSIGIFAALAFGFWQVYSKYFKESFKIILNTFIIGLCMALTLSVNSLWHSNYTIASGWVKNFPDHPAGYFILGLEHLKVDKFSDAAKSFKTCLKLKEKNPQAYHSLGLAYRAPYFLGLCNRDDFQETVNYFKEAINANPFFTAAYVHLSQQYMTAGKSDQAIFYLKKGIQIMPNNLTLYERLIQIYSSLNRAQEAQLVLNAAQNSIQNIDALRYLKAMIK
ncbi:MAG: tetratricopeptide repeat protein [Candidatus Omnitrophota bacterium]